MSVKPAPAYKGSEPYIFVSYATRDFDLASPYIAALQKDFRVYYDEGTLQKGAKWTKEIVEKLSGCSLFIFLVSGAALVSDNCADEIYAAREQEKEFINILIDENAQLPDDFSFRYGKYPTYSGFAYRNAEAAIEDIAAKNGGFSPCIYRPKAAPSPAPASRPAPTASYRVAPEPTRPAPTPSFSGVSKGSVIRMGTYEQEGLRDPIEWVVLDEDAEGILLFSVNILDEKKYHEKKGKAGWASCSLRHFLNETFFDEAFSLAEQSKILQRNIPVADNTKYHIKGEGPTNDRIFLLSMEEIERYFPGGPKDRMGPYTRKSKADSSSFFAKTGWYWLRNPGCDLADAAGVKGNGKFDIFGYMNNVINGVRPAMWVKK